MWRIYLFLLNFLRLVLHLERLGRVAWVWVMWQNVPERPRNALLSIRGTSVFFDGLVACFVFPMSDLFCFWLAWLKNICDELKDMFQNRNFHCKHILYSLECTVAFLRSSTQLNCLFSNWQQHFYSLFFVLIYLVFRFFSAPLFCI